MIREMVKTEKEVNEVMQIWLESVVHGHRFIPESYWQNEYKTVEHHYLPMSKTYVYEENHKIKGFISVINEDFIGALFVGPKYQKQGIGEKLIGFVKEKHVALKLAVYCKNAVAIQFYEKHGFKIESTEMNEETGEANYIMGCSVTKEVELMHGV